MLFELILRALMIIATSLSTAHNSDATVTGSTVLASEKRVVTFELPSFENLIDIKKENEDIWMIDLPEVEIVATYTGKDSCEAKEENEDIWMIDLPEVEIVATYTGENNCSATVENKDIWMIDLPEVEIVATYTGQNRYEATIIDGEVVPMIHLDEVVITAPKKQS